MNASREHELIKELRVALSDLADAREEEEEAKRVVVGKKTVRQKFEALVAEIQEEIQTGKRRDPLIELMETNGEGEADTADERQRGPTASRPRRERADARTADAVDQADAEEPVGKAEWDIPGHHTTVIATPAGADYVHAKYALGYSAGRHHVELRGPVSESGFRSHFFERPPGWTGDLGSYLDRLARHMVRLNGIDAAEAKDAPAWRKLTFNALRWEIGSGFDDEKLMKALHKGRLFVLGDLADAVDLECHRCLEDGKGGTAISLPKWNQAREALGSYLRRQPSAGPSAVQAPAAAPIDPCSLHEGTWRDTSVRVVFKGAEITGELKHRGITNLGELADAAAGRGLFDALDQHFTRTEIVSIEHDLAAWIRRHPKGFPADLVEALGEDLTGIQADEAAAFDMATPAGPEPAADREPAWAYADEALKAALWPGGKNPEWNRFRKFGSISNREVAEVLRSIWPAEHVYTRDAINDGDGWTTCGGASPGFWVGDATGPGPKPIGLEDLHLLDAIRRVLRIPAPGGLPRLPGGPAEYPPPPETVADGPAKKRKRKPAPAVVAD